MMPKNLAMTLEIRENHDNRPVQLRGAEVADYNSQLKRMVGTF